MWLDLAHFVLTLICILVHLPVNEGRVILALRLNASLLRFKGSLVCSQEAAPSDELEVTGELRINTGFLLESTYAVCIQKSTIFHFK